MDSKCCMKPIADIGLATTLAKCNPKKNKDLNKWLNDYMLFKWQNVKKNNTIDLTLNGIK